VVSCSWGATTPTLVRLQDELANAGVLTVWANGNTGGDGSANHSNPAATDDPTPGVLAIAGYDDGATGTRDGQVAATSSRGRADAPQTWPDISAPGVNIISTCRPYLAICPAIETQSPRDGPGPADVATYFIGSGTSFAAPEVAGVIALLLQVAPGSSAAQIDDVLKATAYKFTSGAPYRAIGAYSSSFDKGVGLVDAYNAARRLGARRRSAR
jgi:serine protease AprX